VIVDPAGNLYGTTYYGGGTAGGVVYKLDPAGHETVLHSFPNGRFGTFPAAGLTRDAAGKMYGTSSAGGTSGFGVVYRLDAEGNYAELYSFSVADGATPGAAVTLDSAGNIYGTTVLGGTIAHPCNGGGSYPNGCGVVYKLDPAGRETTLHSFTGGADGAFPHSGVILDSAGNLYGTAGSGGTAGHGVVYKLDPAGNETVLYSFMNGVDGSGPAGVIRDDAGNFYGTTCCGGIGNRGVVYKLDAAGKFTVLYSFTGGADGGEPASGVIRDRAGNLYGTTYSGGVACSPYPYGLCGVVYKLDPAGHETVLYTFTGGADGGQPLGGLIRDPAGNLYGAATYGATADSGTVYKLDTAGNYTVLYSFNCDGTDGCWPWAGVVRDAAGNLYGTTYEGGKRGTGVVFKIKPQ
jgi:uncharacterized repeat protein (TIGR03803 family)